MSVGNDYSFDNFIDWRESVDYYRDDPELQGLLKHYAGKHWKSADKAAKQVATLASGRWNRCAEIAAGPENHPSLTHFDAHNRRIDHILRASETLSMEAEIFGLGLYSDSTTHWQRLIQLFLIYQNGEASICCPLTCTEGLAAMLERHADSPELEHIKRHLTQGLDGDFAIGAQYLSEIQGGSDVNANRVEAREHNGEWRIYGKKFFCSAAHADYALISAKPQGSDQIAAFVVPAWLDGAVGRNGYRIERLKWKMGTCELPTAEIDFDGALAYPLGPMEQGLANIVAIVLSCSRLTVGIFSAAVMTRAAREAQAYAQFRQAFGRPIAEFPMLAAQLEQIETAARQTSAGVFKLAHLIEQRDQNLDGKSHDARRLEFDVRMLIMLQKITAARDSVDCLHMALSVFGGHGAIEDFSVLPRLLRDAMVNELWEGPRNVLLAQIHRDMQKASEWYPLGDILDRLLADCDSLVIDELKHESKSLLNNVSLVRPSGEVQDLCQRWEVFCDRLTHQFQKTALAQAR